MTSTHKPYRYYRFTRQSVKIESKCYLLPDKPHWLRGFAF